MPRSWCALAIQLVLWNALSVSAVGQVWAVQAKLRASDAAPDEQFGTSVALWLDTAVVGAHGDSTLGTNSGAAYVYVESGGAWNEQARLMAAAVSAGSRFGRCVDLRLDTAVVGAPGHLGPGAAWVFRRIAGVWSEETLVLPNDPDPGDEFGWSVSISGNALVVGAFRDDQGGVDAGAAYVFIRTPNGWLQMAKIVAMDAAPGDSFGYSVNIYDDTIVVGAPGDDDMGSGSGSAYVFVRNGANWVQQAKLLPSDGAAFDSFGRAAAISGDSILVGAFGNNTGGSDAGSAYVFVRGGLAWIQQARLLAVDAQADDWFGSSVDISADTAVIGALSVDVVGVNSGAAYVFERTGSTWQQQDRLEPPDAESGDQYGIAVSLSGDKIVVGASFDDDGGRQSGSAHVHRFMGAGTWEDLGGGSPGAFGTPLLTGAGSLTPDSPASLEISQCPPNALILAWVAPSSTPWNVLGGTIHAFPHTGQMLFHADIAGGFRASTIWPGGVPQGTEGWFQFLVQDVSVPDQIILSNALKITTP